MDITSFDFNLISICSLIIFGAYLFGGIVDSVCGGGGLITVPTLMSVGMSPHMVVGTNQCSLILGAWTAFAEYARAGKIDFRICMIALPFSLLGAFIGSRLNLVFEDRYLEILMIVLIPVLAVYSVIRRDVGSEDHSDEVSPRGRVIGAAAIGLVVSAYNAFYGPASGVFYLIGFAAFLKFDAVKANGNARLILACVCVVSSIVYWTSGCVCMKAVIVSTAGYIVGNIIGSRLAIMKGAKVIRPLYYCVLAGLLIKLAFGLFG